MKYLILALFGLSLTQVTLANDLSATQAQALLTEIDNICGDTWCEGDFNFSFNSLVCDFTKGECTLDYEFIDYYFDANWDITGEVRTPASCTFEANSLEHISENRTWGLSYSDYLYETVTDCIWDAEPDANRASL